MIERYILTNREYDAITLCAIDNILDARRRGMVFSKAQNEALEVVATRSPVQANSCADLFYPMDNEKLEIAID